MDLGILIQQTLNALTIGAMYALIALGYTMVYGIIERHGGTLDVQSQLGQGTTVVARLPIVSPAPAPGGSAVG